MSVQSNSPTDPPPMRLIVEALSRRYGEDSVVSDLSLLVRAAGHLSTGPFRLWKVNDLAYDCGGGKS